MADQSIKDLAYRTAASVFGGPVDLATMVMRPFGYNTPDTEVFGSSEYIGKKMEDVGLVSSARSPLTEFLSSIAVPSPATVAKGLSLGAAKSLAMFVGPRSLTWDSLAAGKAKTMEEMGTDARTIWKETGTWKGPDGKWRQEIDSSAAQIENIPPPLQDINKAQIEQEKWNNSSILMNPKELKTLNKIEDVGKYKQILESMKESGYQGRPILAYMDKGKAKALTGSHRLYAARKAGIDVPVVFVKPSVMKWEDQKGFFNTFQESINDQRIPAHLKAAGDDVAASLAALD
jgi:hypothetical protein